MTPTKWKVVVASALVASTLAGLWIVPRIGVPARFWLAPLETVSLAGRELRVVRVPHAQGLREVESLGTLDGALFVLERPASTESGMGMNDVLIPLDVIFFDTAGRFLVRHTMPLCTDEDCPGYFPPADWQYAIEGPAGSLAWVPADAILSR